MNGILLILVIRIEFRRMAFVEAATIHKNGSQRPLLGSIQLANIGQKLALGTVQFGLPYGIANKSGIVSYTETRAILDEALVCGIDTLDTAIGYGGSEEKLGRLNVAAFRIVSKLPAVSGDCRNVSTWVRDQLEGSLCRLGISALDGFLLHCPLQLMESGGDEVYSALSTAKEQGLIKKLIQSVAVILGRF